MAPALPTHPKNALSARVTSSFKQFGSEFPFASYLTLWVMVKGEPQKAKTLLLPFVPYLRSTVPETTEPKDLIQGHFRKYQLGNAYHL